MFNLDYKSALDLSPCSPKQFVTLLKFLLLIQIY